MAKPKSAKDRRSGGRDSAKNPRVFLYGVHAVRAALENERRRSFVLHATPNGLSRLPERLVAESGVKTSRVEPSTLDRLAGADAVHQGIVLECDPLPVIDGSDLFDLADAKLLLVLDQISDPHNVGAILRSAVAFGVDAVLVPHRGGAAQSGVLAKSASGAVDMIDMIDVRNLSKALQELEKMGFCTIGLDSDGPMPMEETLTSAPAKIALVLGAEGKGLRQGTREACTHLARLDMPGRIRSLNVSNAAALSLYVAQRHLATQDDGTA